MSFSEEKMLILKMLEEGKITGEEAAKLLEALEGGPKKTAGENTTRQQQKQQPNFQDEVSKVRDRINQWKKEFKNNYNQKDFDHMVEEFSTKAEKLGKNLATTTFGIVDKVIDFVGSFVDTNAFNIFGSYPTIEKTFETVAAEGAELYIEGTNGQILVKKHNDSKIMIKSKIRSPQPNAENILAFSDNGSLVSLRINKVNNLSVSHEIFLPAVKFGKIKLETSNGKIYVEDSSSEQFEGITRNSPIELMGVNSSKLTVITKNSKIQLSYVIGRDIDINTSNSVIDIKHIKAENIKAVTINGKITVDNAQNYDSSPQMNMNLKSSNGGIKINMNDMENRGYKVKAQAASSGVNLLIPEIKYNNINKQGPGGTFVEAESNLFETYPAKVFINAETINGFIEIVK